MRTCLWLCLAVSGISALAQDQFSIGGRLAPPPPHNETITAATVRLRSKEDPAFKLKTDVEVVSGQFRFFPLARGKYELVGLHAAQLYLPGCAQVTLPPSKAKLQVSLLRGELVPVGPRPVTDTSGHPLKNAKVRLVPICHDWDDEGGYKTTDANGRADFGNVVLALDHRYTFEWIVPSPESGSNYRGSEHRAGSGPAPQPDFGFGSGIEVLEGQSETPPKSGKFDGVIGKRAEVPLLVPTDNIVPKAWRIDLKTGAVSADVGLSPAEKLRLHLKRLVNPASAFLPAVVAAVNQGRDLPPEWGQGAAGLARRYGSAYMYTYAVRNFMAFTLDATMRLDPRYFPSKQGHGRGRFAEALLQTLVTRTDSGRITVNYWRIGSAYGAGFLSNCWYPDHSARAGDALVRGTTALGLDTIANVLREFYPDIRRRVLRR